MPKTLKYFTRFIVPALTIYMEASIVMFVLNGGVDAIKMSNIILGIVMLVIGNYLPKYMPSHTYNMRLPWTLASEYN